MDGEVRLYSNMRERERHDNLADLFAIIKSTEALEKAYMRDAVTNEEYAAALRAIVARRIYKQACAKFISQFRASRSLCQLDDDEDLFKFMKEMRLECKAARKRLLEEGIPGAAVNTDDSAKTIAETVQYFITAMDSLKLEMRAIDQLYPLISDLYECLCKISTLPSDWKGKLDMKKWLTKMNSMKASEELDDESVRQVLFDLENAYAAFHKSLSST